MAETQPQEQPPLPPRNKVIHNSAIAGAIISPLAMLLPPRRMDVRFFVLAGTFSLSTNQLAYAYTGSSIYSRFTGRVGSFFGGMAPDRLPEGARRTQQLLRERKEWEAAEMRRQEGISEAAAAAKKAEEDGKGALDRVWMGNETEGWKERRAEEHRKKLEEGQSIAGLIMEQVAEVFGSGSKGDKNEGGDDAAGAAGQKPGEAGKK